MKMTKIGLDIMVAVILVAASTVIMLPVRPAKAQETEASASSSCGGFATHKILRDNRIGHIRGWDPNGVWRTFFISDKCVDPIKSTVLINTIQGNYVVCSVDYLVDEGFEVNCDLAPSDGGELHYIVFNKSVTSALALLEDSMLPPNSVATATARLKTPNTHPLAPEQMSETATNATNATTAAAR
jgi:hypothetical protein